MKGQWVTLHIQHFGGGEDKHILGYLEQDGTPGYRLTKLVTEQEGLGNPGEGYGRWTTIHGGTWIIAPQFVWMVEYEEAAPVAGFRPQVSR